MPTYDFRCADCDLTEERSCMIAERESQRCGKCGGPVTQLFTPTTNFYTPERFRHSFSDLFGTTSEKDWLKEHPEATRVSPSRFKTKREKNEARWTKAHKEVADIEKALKANKTLVAPRGKKKSRSAA